jgi:hypothetical protein
VVGTRAEGGSRRWVMAHGGRGAQRSVAGEERAWRTRGGHCAVRLARIATEGGSVQRASGGRGGHGVGAVGKRGGRGGGFGPQKRGRERCKVIFNSLIESHVLCILTDSLLNGSLAIALGKIAPTSCLFSRSGLMTSVPPRQTSDSVPNPVFPAHVFSLSHHEPAFLLPAFPAPASLLCSLPTHTFLLDAMTN